MNYPVDGKYYTIAKKISNNNDSIAGWYKRCGGIGVVVVTDKQQIFVTENLFLKHPVHLELANMALNVIYDTKFEPTDLPTENTYCFIFESNLYPVFAINVFNLSLNQYTFLCNIIDEIDNYNHSSAKAVEFWMFFDEDNTIYTFDAKLVKDKLLLYIDSKKETNDKYIIGKTLTEKKYNGSIKRVLKKIV